MTEKFFEFNLQLFALPETATIGASDNNVVVEGSDTVLGAATTATADSVTAAAILDANYSPAEGETHELDGTTYTYDGSNWTYDSDTTATADSDAAAAITAQYYTPADGDTRTLDDVVYTFTDGNWTYESETTTPETADSDTVAQIIAQYYTPSEGDIRDDYTYTNGVWVTTTTAENQDEITANWLAANAANPEEGATQDDYTYTNGEWVTTTAAENQDEITANWQADNAANPEDGATQDSYTYTNGAWVAEADNQDDITAQWQADNAANPEEGATQDNYTFDGSNWYAEADDSDAITALWQDANPDAELNGDASYTDPDTGVYYTYKNSVWTYEAPADEQDTITADWQAANAANPEEGATQDDYTYTNGAWVAEADNQDEITAQWQAANAASPSEGATQDDYTYTNGAWVTTTTADDSDAITAQWQAANAANLEDGATQDDYTYTNGAWVTTTTADEETVNQILATHYTPAEGDARDDYTYTGGEWTYANTSTETAAATAETAAAIIAEYYTPAEGATHELDGTTYTYDGASWNFDTTTTATATSAIADSIKAQFYSPAENDTKPLDGVDYTYTAAGWTYEYSPTVTSYYQFSASVSSAEAPVVIQSATTTGALANTSISSSAVIGGNGSAFAVKGVGTVNGLDNGETFAVTASDGKLANVTLSGDIELAGDGKNVAVSLNDAALDYSTSDKGESVSFTSSDDLVIAHADNAVTLKSIDDKQEWLLNADSDAALTFGKVAYSALGEVYVTASNSVITASLDDGEALIMAKDGSGRTDVVSVNGVTVSSAAKAGGETSSTIAAEDDILVLTAGANGGNVTVNSDSVALAAGGKATVSGTGSDAAVTAVDKLDPNGKWITDQSDISIGNLLWTNNSGGAVTLVADSDSGSSISKVNFASGSVALNATAAAAADVNVNGKATWILSGTDDDFEDFARFDSDANATLAGSDRATNTAALSSGKNVTLTAANSGDVLILSKHDVVTVQGDDTVSANSIAAGGNWSVKADTAALGDYTLTGASGAVITADKSKGNVISSIANLPDDATLSYGDSASINGLTVGDATWTIKGAEVDSDASVSTAVFNAKGDVTVSAGDSALEISAASDADSGAAVVNITNGEAAAKINGVNVNYSGDEDGLDFTLEDKGNNAGIAAISGAEEGTELEVDGDTLYTVNQFTYANAARDVAAFTVYEDVLSLRDVKDNDIVTISGGDGIVNFDDSKKSSVAVSINGAGVSIDAAAADDIADIAITTSDNGKVDGISGVDSKATINTSGDGKFYVTYDKPEDAAVTLNVNNTQIQIGEGAVYDKDYVGLNVDGSNVTLTGVSFGAEDTLTVTGGNYKIGRSAAVGVTETLGYITFDQHGNATAVEKSVVDNENAREGAIDSVEAAALAAQPPVLALYQRLGTDNSGAPNSTVAGYDDASDSDASTSSVEGGINIYGNAALNSGDLTQVNLQSFTDDDIVVFEAEDSSIRESVIDVSGGKASVVAIDPQAGTTGVNHTVTGSNIASYIKFGKGARGNNYATAGSVGSYLANEGGTATLVGGAGADSIAAKKGDKVTGGAGADYFFDANGAYLISDYDATQGDVLVATKLADINKNLDAQTLVDKITVKDNTINIAGGGKFTLGGSGSSSSDATVSALNVRFTDSNAQDIHKLTWAAAEGGNVNASAFTEGSVLMVADQNNGASDSVVGSSGNDTIFVGGNDTVNAGAGKDEIYLSAAGRKQEGAVVQLGGGRTYVHGWQFGFDNAAGDNILNADASRLTFDNKEDTLLAYNSSDTLYFVDNDSNTEVFDILTGTPDDATKVSVIRSSMNVQVQSDDDVADYYYTAADVDATLTFAEGVGDIADTIRMDGGNWTNIHKVALTNNGAATLVGTDDKDVLVLGGATEAGARKHVSLGGGNDSVISGGSSTSVAGNTFYFGLEADGADVINDFGYYQGSAADADRSAADKIILYNWAEGVSAVTANGKNVEIKVNDNSKLTLQEESISPDNKILYQLGYDGDERVMQIGKTSGGTNAFTYDKETFVYVGNQEGQRDTLSVSSPDENVEVWLDGQHGTVFNGIGVIDASASTGTQLTLAGGYQNDTIIAGGEGTSNSLWGGGYGDNELIAGSGNDVFFFTRSASNDTITGIDASNDRVRMGDITIDDLVEGQAYFFGDDVKLELKTGGSLTIKDANGVQVEMNNGDGSYHAYTATKTGSDWSWQD